MFNNDINYIEYLITDERDLGAVLDNKPEKYADIQKRVIPADDRVFKQSRVDSMLWAYRDIGYLYANLNPLGKDYEADFTRLVEFRNESYHRLSLEDFGLGKEDLETEFFGGKTIGRKPLREILKSFDRTYCSSVGVEFLHIQNREIREWLIERMESTGNRIKFSAEQRRTILSDLMKSDELENALQRNFIGQTRFSIQGADAVIPALHYIADSSHEFGIEEIVIGTSHRGRLSILNIVLDLSPEDIFFRFEENFTPEVPGGSGDVKYHIGYCTRHANEDGTSVNITLLPNSSHLESVDPVVAGDCRGMQDMRKDGEKKKIIPVILHGDASFPAQGIVAETFNLSRLTGYATGGTVHIIINNQLGFTTSAEQGRSGLNPTDIVKMLPVPIFHVNGDKPEAVLSMIRLALEYRQTFNRDVVVDVYCYRKYGHNEGDEPSFTQPQMYSLIKDRESLKTQYRKQCLDQGIVTKQELDETSSAYKKALDKALKKQRENKPRTAKPIPNVAGNKEKNIITAVEEKQLRHIAEKLSEIPGNFNIHPRLKKIIENNYKRFSKENTVDWAAAESLAFGSLLMDGVPVRLSGEDSERGTFSQRHLVWRDVSLTNPGYHIPLANLSEDQAEFSVYDSPLSELAVLGFEYGYATARRDSLVIWEAQYGDFVNGGQVIIDNYIIPGQSKWNVENGLVMLLPHGFEGMGPDHSTGYLERFLQLCAEDNIRVCNLTRPAQYFHLLRLQMKRKPLKPLIIMTPKSLLRNPLSVSAPEDLSGGNFQQVINEDHGNGKNRLLFCSGKIYYDLIKKKNEKQNNTGIVRVEQLYPFPADDIGTLLKEYSNVSEFYWVQEEPRNRGAWTYIKEQFENFFRDINLQYIGRKASASPASGSLKEHREEQENIVARAIP